MSRFADESNIKLKMMDMQKIQSIMIEDETMDSFIIIKTESMMAKIQYDYIYDVDVSKRSD